MAVTDAAAVLLYEARGTAERKTDAVIYVDDVADTVHVGGPNVTNAGANRGVPVAQASPLSISGIQGDKYYGICAAGQSCDVIVLENGY